MQHSAEIFLRLRKRTIAPRLSRKTALFQSVRDSARSLPSDKQRDVRHASDLTPEFAVGGVLFCAELHHPRGEHHLAPRKQPQHFERSPRAVGVGVVGVVDDPDPVALDELQSVRDGRETRDRFRDLFGRETQAERHRRRQSDVLDVVHPEQPRRALHRRAVKPQCERAAVRTHRDVRIVHPRALVPARKQDIPLPVFRNARHFRQLVVDHADAVLRPHIQHFQLLAQDGVAAAEGLEVLVVDPRENGVRGAHYAHEPRDVSPPSRPHLRDKDVVRWGEFPHRLGDAHRRIVACGSGENVEPHGEHGGERVFHRRLAVASRDADADEIAVGGERAAGSPFVAEIVETFKDVDDGHHRRKKQRIDCGQHEKHGIAQIFILNMSIEEGYRGGHSRARDERACRDRPHRATGIAHGLFALGRFVHDV